MKRNILKLLITALIVPAVITACKDERNNFMADDTISFANQYASVSVLNEKYELAVIKSGKGRTEATAVLSPSMIALDAYNTANGTDYVYLPEDYYEFAQTVSFSEGDARKFIEITWKDSEIATLDRDKSYAIPIRVSVAGNTLEVPEERSTIIVNLGWSNIAMGVETADPISPKASRETAVYEGPIVIDNPVTIMDVDINYAIDYTLIGAYNNANGTSYLAPPDGFVSLAASSSTIAAGQAETTFKVQLNSASLFTGNELNAVDNNEYLIPVKITGLSNEALGLDCDIMYIPVVMHKTLMGPWTILEGQEYCYAEDPNLSSDWYKQYTADKLFDGNTTKDAGDWVSWFETTNVFPLTFVADMGDAHVFTKFFIKDANSYQSTMQDFEMYTAEVYNGAGTTWNRVAAGQRSEPGAWYDGGGTYFLNVDKMVAGRYLKIVMVKHARPDTTTPGSTYQFGKARLSEIYGEGF